MGKNPGVVFLLGTAAAAWLIYDTATTVEGPSQTLRRQVVHQPAGETTRPPGLRSWRKAQDRPITSSG
jgi:hypothetical protein